ncbi:condensin complex subunit 1 [Microplitis mediator]|uniref:condensin complex subunit 1 n=1 Tax=Microplitis mediator TaxID=375433 RepID=UPI00255281DE|nr:condensin complex subunit 1 [Microplitis mediator]
MEFIIPLKKDDLLKQSDRNYYVNDVISPRQINSAFDTNRQALQNKRSAFILDHFDDFFAVLVHSKNLDNSVLTRAFDRLCKSTEYLVKDLENQDFEEDKKKKLCIVKMHAYLVSSFMNYLEDHSLKLNNPTGDKGIGKKKKSEQKSEVRKEWEFKRNKILFTIYDWLQLSLNKLWDPPIVEQSFVMLMADICYKIIELDKDKNDKQVKQIVWQILGILIKNYTHAVSCKIKIIQLVKTYETLAQSLAQGIVNMVTENKCQSFIVEILHEIDQVNFEESEARNIALFLSTMATIQPKLFFQGSDDIMEYIFDYLDNECYIMRNCAIEIMENLIINCLSGENLTKQQKNLRDDCFQYLFKHKLDVNSFVRSKVFQVWQKLLSSATVPIQQMVPILKAVIPHLHETGAVMRKQALQVIRHLIECNPYGFKFDKQELIEQRDKCDENLRQIQADFVTESASGDSERIELWKDLLPGILEAIKKYFENNDEDEENSDDDDDDLEDFNIDKQWESVRSLIVDRKFLLAVKRVKIIVEKLNLDSDINNIDGQEDCFLFFLAYIFLNSQSDNNNKNKFDSFEWKKRKETVSRLKQTLNIYDSVISFITELESAIPTIKQMLNAATPGVAIESCTLLGTAYKFNISGAEKAFHTALLQAFSRDESVKKNVAEVYKEIYFQSEVNIPNRQRAIISVNGLINLLKTLKSGQSPALEQLVSEWCDKKDLDEESWQVMWEKYNFKNPSTTIIESRCAITLLKMVAAKNPKLILKNLNICIKVGFQTKDDILLARDTCKAILMIKSDNSEVFTKEPLKFENNHELFQSLSSLLVNKFETASSMSYASFATEAINVIYQFANTPDIIIKDILLKLLEEPTYDVDVPKSQLAKFLYVIGHIAVRHMVHLDVEIYKELKRRNAIRDTVKGKKKNNMNNTHSNESLSSSPASVQSSARKARQSISVHRRNIALSEDAEDEILSGATADDVDAEAINEALDNNVVNDNGLLAQFVPLVIEVCQHPEKYNDKYIQVWGVLALTKMMTVSSKFCQDHLQLLMTILEKSTYPEIRSNILIGLSDLMIRFTNDIDPWTSHMYNRLTDPDVLVRRTAVRILSSLVKREMIRAKGQMSEMALCIIDKDEQIRNDAQLFFRELSKKPNVLCNILPDILSKFSCSDEDKVDEEDIQTIFKFIFSLLSKEREMESVLDKICFRFKDVTTERQSKTLTYCLSLLQLNKKGITHLTRNLPFFKDKLHNKHVYDALWEVIEQAKKKPDVKEACAILEQEIDKLLDNPNSDNIPVIQSQDKQNQNNTINQNNNDNNKKADREFMPPPKISPPKRRSTRHVNKRKK